MNTLVISATVVSIAPLRYTPAGLPLLQLQLQHASQQQDSGLQRNVQCQFSAVIMGTLTQRAIQVGDAIKAKGFIAQRSAKSTHLVLHIQDFQHIPQDTD